MNKHGFTLIEILITIALISIVATIVVVNMTGILSNQDSDSYITFKNTITSAACAYIDMDENKEIRENCKLNNEGCNISIKSLINSGLIASDLKDYSTNMIIEDEIEKYYVHVYWQETNDYKEKKCILESN